MLEVKVKDRKEDIEVIRMALNMAQIGITYCQADLIKRTFEVLKTKKTNFSIEDSVKIFYKWSEDWEKYFEEQTNRSEIPNSWKK